MDLAAVAHTCVWLWAFAVASFGVLLAAPFLLDVRVPFKEPLVKRLISAGWVHQVAGHKFSIWCSLGLLSLLDLALLHHRARGLLLLFTAFWFPLACKLLRLQAFDRARLQRLEADRVQRRILQWKKPSLRPWHTPMKLYQLAGTKWFGLENLPPELPGLQRRPYMFVMNHAIWGLEMPYFVYSLMHQTGICVRALADHVHWCIPGWGEFLDYAGAVDGTPQNCDLLFDNGFDVLVFPGGTPEVMKTKADRKYQLKWKDRLGFARAAIRHGCTVVPVNSFGSEDMFEIAADVNVERLFGGKRKGLTMPLLKPPTPGKLQRIYFRVGRPIPTEQLQRNASDENAAWLRDQCRAAIEGGIEESRRFQSSDPGRFTLARWGLKAPPSSSASAKKPAAEQSPTTTKKALPKASGAKKRDEKKQSANDLLARSRGGGGKGVPVPQL